MLYNHTPQHLPYACDVRDMMRQNASHATMGHHLWRVLNPQGMIAPHSCHALRVLFHPLHTRTYHVTLPIHITSHAIDADDTSLPTHVVMLCARGVLPQESAVEPFPAVSSIPAYQVCDGMHMYAAFARIACCKLPCAISYVMHTTC